jgi:hypothetical protein
MSKLKLMSLLLFCICIAPLTAVAGEFDGSKPLLCAAIEVMECVPGGGCQKVTPEAVNLPRFLRMSFKEKRITAPRGSEQRGTTVIEDMEHIDGKLILEGAEDGFKGVRDGLGWNIAINEESGDMVLTASGDRVGFVVFGACTLQ